MTEHQKHRWSKWGLIVGFTLLCLAPLAACFWVIQGQNLMFRWTLPQYPGAQPLTEAYGYYGAGTGSVALYSWTADPTSTVIDHFENTVLPFVEAEYNDIHGYRSIYTAADGAVPPVMTTEFGHDMLYPLADRPCHFTLRNNCAVIELFDLAEVAPVVLPSLPAGTRMVRTPAAPPLNIEGGTIIIYRYYVTDIS